MKFSSIVIVFVAVALLADAALAETSAKRCGKRKGVKWGQSIDSRKDGRAIVYIDVPSITLTANNGAQRTLVKGNPFYNCGCDKSGVCVIYGDKVLHGFDQHNPLLPGETQATTFFANIPRKRGGKLTLKFTSSTASKKRRGAVPLRRKPTKLVKRRIIATNIRNEDIFHGPGAPMWEYTWLANGRFVTGAATPASFYRNGQKLGTGYNTGLFEPGKQTFYDVCAPIMKTKVRRWSDPVAGPWDGQGTVEWVFGYVLTKGPRGTAKVWAWMIKSIALHGKAWSGNVAF
jgi:hypothetical protein